MNDLQFNKLYRFVKIFCIYIAVIFSICAVSITVKCIFFDDPEQIIIVKMGNDNSDISVGGRDASVQEIKYV